MTEATNPPLPPLELSIFKKVDDDWLSIRKQVDDNQNVSIAVATITQKLADVIADFKAGKLDTKHDWKRDIEKAQIRHSQWLAWLSDVEGIHAARAAHWKDITNRQYALAEKLMISGVNYIIAGHGAVAIACLNALVGGKNTAYSGALKVAIAGALIGLIVIAAAQVLAAEGLSHTSSVIQNRMIARPSRRRLNTIDRYSARMYRTKMKWVFRWNLDHTLGTVCVP